jgi:hypothetical protein
VYRSPHTAAEVRAWLRDLWASRNTSNPHFVAALSLLARDRRTRSWTSALGKRLSRLRGPQVRDIEGQIAAAAPRA